VISQKRRSGKVNRSVVANSKVVADTPHAINGAVLGLKIVGMLTDFYPVEVALRSSSPTTYRTSPFPKVKAPEEVELFTAVSVLLG
jgi:hypothetical protein